jgi:arginyl-tRNA--protein-N-Asp/Glu arginylyltransferase
MHDDSRPTPECSYCNGKRQTFLGEETDLPYYKVGFSTTKLRVDDYEKMIDAGFSRCGTYVYSRNPKTSCCEAYQYRVEAEKFKPSDS